MKFLDWMLLGSSLTVTFIVFYVLPRLKARSAVIGVQTW